MGKRVIILNPFSIWPDCIGPGAARFRGLEKLCDFTGSYNPMATLDPSSDAFVPDAEGLGQAIVYQEHEGEHWTDSARDLVTGLILYATVYGAPAEKNLAWVRSTICNRTRLFALAQKFFGVDAMSEAEDFIQQKLGRFGEPEAKDNKEIGSDHFDRCNANQLHRQRSDNEKPDREFLPVPRAAGTSHGALSHPAGASS